MKNLDSHENFCLILCGGKGTRLWPVSNNILPKQFVPLNNDKSLLDETIERNLEAFSSNNIFFVTDESNKFHTGRAAKKYGIGSKNVIVEPSARDTCAAVALGFKVINGINSNSKVYVIPSDHHIESTFNVKNYLESIEDNQDFVIFGINPTEPNINYGYIKVNNLQTEIQRVEEFKEKPDLETAKEYLISEKYFWNSGMFYINSSAFFEELELHNKEINTHITNTEKKIGKYDFYEFEHENYNQIEPISLDYALMEKVSKIVVKRFAFTWSDLGNWPSFFEYLKVNNNKLSKKLAYSKSSNDINVFNDTNQDISILGLENIDIINTRDDLFILDNQHEHNFKDIYQEIMASKLERSKELSIDYRPWGWFENLLDLDNYKVKRLCIYPNSRLSLQKHYKRSEHWVVVKGKGDITKGQNLLKLKEGDAVFLEKEEIHRIENHSNEDLIIIETQMGECIEDDIVRYEDDFNRT